MINSMTGFGSRIGGVACLGKVCVEIKSSNHRYLETVLHLPEGFLSLEEPLRKEIEAKIKRGRIVLAINVMAGQSKRVFFNEKLLKDYLLWLNRLKKQFRIQDNLSLATLINLPGVLSLAEIDTAKAKVWLGLKRLVNQAISDLVRARQKEGAVLVAFLKTANHALKKDLEMISARFKKVIAKKASQIKIEEERLAFLKDSDITEEIKRLAFHARNFNFKLDQSSPLGKELDFITQEMQREANTIGAKSCDVWISGRVVQLKSRIEKMREQIQNIE